MSNRFSLSFVCELAGIFAFVDRRRFPVDGREGHMAGEDGCRDQFVNLTGHRLPVGDLDQRNAL